MCESEAAEAFLADVRARAPIYLEARRRELGEDKIGEVLARVYRYNRVIHLGEMADNRKAICIALSVGWCESRFQSRNSIRNNEHRTGSRRNRLGRRTERGASMSTALGSALLYRLGLLSPLPASPEGSVEQDGTEEFSP